jgi:hypothetical protein
MDTINEIITARSIDVDRGHGELLPIWGQYYW